MGYLRDNKEKIERMCVRTLMRIVADPKALRGDRIRAASELLARTTPASKHVSFEAIGGPALIYVSSVAQAREALAAQAHGALEQPRGELVSAEFEVSDV